jgi:hypothetical protein
VNNFSCSITSSQERACSFFSGELPHTAILINGSVLPERDKAATRRPFYPVFFGHRSSGYRRSPEETRAPYKEENCGRAAGELPAAQQGKTIEAVSTELSHRGETGEGAMETIIPLSMNSLDHAERAQG